MVPPLTCELATRHLTERQLAIGEIAFLLGFSEARCSSSKLDRAVRVPNQ